MNGSYILRVRQGLQRGEAAVVVNGGNVQDVSITLLASGMKMSAAPKPEKPRASPAMSAEMAMKTRTAAE